MEYKIPLLMTFIAGLATFLGGFITFIVKKNNLKALSIGLGFSAGVMIFLSLTEILTGASESLKTTFINNYKWLTFLGFITGVIIAILIDYFVPDHIEEDLFVDSEHCDKKHRIKRGRNTPPSFFDSIYFSVGTAGLSPIRLKI